MATQPLVQRKTTLCKLIQLSTAMLGIELAYSIETAFISPILLELGMEHNNMIVIWAISPTIGFFLSPILGMLSDRCTLSLGRRRPFIIGLSLALLTGILLVPLGKRLATNSTDNTTLINNETNLTGEYCLSTKYATIITIAGVVLMDLNADISQSPVRAYLLEVTVPDDHPRGLSLFTAMAGIGGFVGYTFGTIDWNNTEIGTLIGGNVEFIFLTVAIVYVICIILTLTSVRETPVSIISGIEMADEKNENITSIRCYLKSIIFMPRSMIILYVTNLLTWMSHLSYVLYFTDFVGECVFGGNPSALPDTDELNIYNEGVRFGCWGLAIYALSCTIYSFMIEYLIRKFGTKFVYISGLVIYAIGMAILVLVKNKITVLLMSITAGIAYSTLFNIPYLILSQHHTKKRIGNSIKSEYTDRGLGTDIAIIGSTVFMAQLLLSLGLGAITKEIGDISITIWAASALSACAAISATQIVYR